MPPADSRPRRAGTRDDLRARVSPPSAKAGEEARTHALSPPGNTVTAAGVDAARTLDLQRSAGNQAVAGLLRRAAGRPARHAPVPNGAEANDSLELEADRKADEIAMRWGAALGDPRDEDAPPPDGGDGAPLPPGLRRAAEPVLGGAIGDVRVHAGSEGESWATTLDALALTVGRHIYLPRQDFAPDGFAGRHLLAHELAHTAQQSSLGVSFVQRKPRKGAKRGGKRKPRPKPVQVLRVTFYVDLDKVVFYLEGDKVIVLSTDYNGKPRPGSYLIRRKGKENLPTEPIGGTPNESGYSVQWTEPPETPFVYAPSYQFGIRAGRPGAGASGAGEGALGTAGSEGRGTSGGGGGGQAKEGGKEEGEGETGGGEAGERGGAEGSGGQGKEGAGKSAGVGAGDKGGVKGGGAGGEAGSLTGPSARRLTPREEALWRELYEKMTGAPPGPIEDPIELIRLYEILREKVQDPKFGSKGEPWTEFAKFLNKNRDKIEGIIQSGPGGLTVPKMEQIIEEYGKFIAGEPDQENTTQLKSLDDFDKEFQYDPGWAQLSRADRKLLLEYAKLTPEQVGHRKVDFSRVTTSHKVVMALKASTKSWPAEVAEAAKQAFTDPAFIITLIVIMAIYVGLWLTPDPSLVTKIAAGTLTVTLLLQFAWEDIYGLAVAWGDLTDACAAATQMSELEAAGDRFAKKVGQVGFDILCFIVMGRVAKRVAPKVQKVATERLVKNAEAQVTTAEAKPGAGTRPPETAESRAALSDAKAKAASDTPTATLDALGESLPKPARDGLASLRKAQGDKKALAEVEAEVAAGHDLTHSLTERGMSPEARAAVRKEVAGANEAVAQAEAKLALAKSKAEAATGERATAAQAEVEAAAGELAKARGSLTAAEAKPGSGVRKAAPEKPGVPTLLESARTAAKAQTPSAVLDALATKLPKNARDGLAAFRKKLGDEKALRVLESESAAGFDITRFLVEKGTTKAEKTAAQADLLAAEVKLARAEMIKAETFKDPAVRQEARTNAIRRLKARLHEAGILDNPKVAKAMKGGDVTELRGAIGEALGRTQITAWAASKGYRVLSNVGVAREIPGYKTIAEWQAAEIKAGRKGGTEKLVQHKGKVYEMIGEVDALVVEPVKGGKKLRPVAAEEVKSGGETSASALGQVNKAIGGLAEIHGGATDVKVFERPGKHTFGKELTDTLDLSSVGSITPSARGPKGRSGYPENLGYTTEILDAVAKSVVKEGLPPKGPKKVVPQAFPKGEGEEEEEPARKEQAEEPAGATR